MNNSKIQLYVISHSEEAIREIRNDDIYTPLFGLIYFFKQMFYET